MNIRYSKKDNKIIKVIRETEISKERLSKIIELKKERVADLENEIANLENILEELK